MEEQQAQTSSVEHEVNIEMGHDKETPTNMNVGVGDKGVLTWKDP